MQQIDCTLENFIFSSYKKIYNMSKKSLDFLRAMYYTIIATEKVPAIVKKYCLFRQNTFVHIDMRMPDPVRQGAVNHVRRGTEQH